MTKAFSLNAKFKVVPNNWINNKKISGGGQITNKQSLNEIF